MLRTPCTEGASIRTYRRALRPHLTLPLLCKGGRPPGLLSAILQVTRPREQLRKDFRADCSVDSRSLFASNWLDVFHPSLHPHGGMLEWWKPDREELGTAPSGRGHRPATGP